jgi:hypothetical protein
LTRVTIGAVGEGPLSAEMVAQIAAWTADGLLADSYWVTSAGLPHDPFGEITATHAELSGTRTVDLLRSLSSLDVDAVRLIAVVPALPDRLAEAGALEAFSTLEATIGRVLPIDASARRGAIRFTAIRLVVPTSDAAPSDIGALTIGTWPTFVVAPEERPTPGSVATFVNRDGWAAHAASAFCSVAGLWPGIDSGIAEELTSLSGSAQPEAVRVIRTYARTAISPDSTQGLLADAVALAQGTGRMPMGASSGVTPSLRDDALVETGRASIMAKASGMLTVNPHAAAPRPSKRTTGWQAFVELASFAYWCVVMLVRFTADAVIDRAGRGATSLTYGGAGSTEVRFRPGRMDSVEQVAAHEIKTVQADSESMIRMAEGERRSYPAQGVWPGRRRGVGGSATVDARCRRGRVAAFTGGPGATPSDRGADRAGRSAGRRGADHPRRGP